MHMFINKLHTVLEVTDLRNCIRFLKLFDIEINILHIFQREYLLNHTRDNRLCLYARVLFDIRRGKLDIFHPLYHQKRK